MKLEGARGQPHAPPYFTPGKDPVPIVQKVERAPAPFWAGAENLAPTGIRFPDRPAHIQSLYRLRYPVHSYFTRITTKSVRINNQIQQTTNVSAYNPFFGLQKNLHWTIILSFFYFVLWPTRGGTVAQMLCFKSECRWFDSRWCHWNFSLT